MTWLLFVVFIVMPIAEIAVILQIGQLIGWGLTVLLLLLSAVAGSWLLRREGRRAWLAFTTAVASGRPPAREVADGTLVVFGGALMIAPGFITDTLGVLCLFPPTRALLRRVLATSVARRMTHATVHRVRSRRGPGRPYAGPDHPRTIDGELGP